jgi:site-specific DNA-methyltransferase (adenine-specific)
MAPKEKSNVSCDRKIGPFDCCSVVQGDCLELMKQLPDGCVDAVITDPPYGTTACDWDSVIPLDETWKHYRRVCTGAAVFTASQPFTSALVMGNPAWFKYAWVWKKNRATGHVHAKNKPMKIHEDVCVFDRGTTVHASQSKTRMVYNPQGLVKLEAPHVRKRNDAGDESVMSKRASHRPTIQEFSGYPTSIIEFDIEMNEKRVHPTQKPLSLLEYLVSTYTNPNALILDPTFGSGTTLVAAKKLGRHFLGFEISPEYCEIARKRIAAVEAQPTLFEPKPVQEELGL